MGIEKEENVLKSTYANFNSCGLPQFSEKAFEIGKKGTNNKNWIENRLSLSLHCGENERLSFADLRGGYVIGKECFIYAFGKKKDGSTDYEQSIKIEWNKRLEQESIDLVGDEFLITVALEKDKDNNLVYKKFLSGYDAVAYVKEHLTKDTPIKVNGKLEYKTYSNGEKYTETKSIRYIGLALDKNGNFLTEDNFYATFSQRLLLTTSSFEEDKLNVGFNVIHGYSVFRDSGTKKNYVAEHPIYVATKKLAENTNYNVVDKATWSTLVKIFKPDKTKVNVVDIDGRFYNDTKTIDIKESDLPEQIRNNYKALGLDLETLGKAVNGKGGNVYPIFQKIRVSKSENENDILGITFAIKHNEYDETDLVFLQDKVEETKINQVVDISTKSSKKETAQESFDTTTTEESNPFTDLFN